MVSLNRDLFGDLIQPQPTVTPVSVRPKEFITVYHGSESSIPPHERSRRPYWHEDASSNTHTELIHAGTYNAAQMRANSSARTASRYEKDADTLNRGFIHAYEVPKSMLDVTYKDADSFPGPKSLLYVTYKDADAFPDNMIPAQDLKSKEGLWEVVHHASPEALIEKNMVTPYRNMFEDIGSISYIIPKRLINSRMVGYTGSTRAKDWRDG